MDIKKYNDSPSFKRVYVASKEAEKLLKKADRAVKASNAKFLDTNIPEGHKKPLWSVLFEHISKRQKDNSNDIIIDVSKKNKQHLSVTIIDTKNVILNKWNVNPQPLIGKYNEVFPPTDFLTYSAYRNSLNPKTYGKSEFFNIIDKAEAIVNALHEEFLKTLTGPKTHIKELPKNRAKKPKIKKYEHKFIPHTQRPFESLAEKLEKSAFKLFETKKASKLQPKEGSRLPRKAKKEAKRKAGI